MNLVIKSQTVQLSLNWGQKTWRVTGAGSSVWTKEISSSTEGKFIDRDWGVIWINDNGRYQELTRLIIWDAPKTDSDALHTQGQARIFQPKRSESALRNKLIPWSIDKTASVKVEEMTEVHRVIVKVLQEAFKNVPIKVGDKTYKSIAAPFVQSTEGTNCIIMGGVLAYILGMHHKGYKENSKALDTYVRAHTLIGTTGVPKKAKSAWRDADGTIFPAPGSLFALIKQDLPNTKENRQNGGLITHVGVLLEYRNNKKKWVTADFGQNESPGGQGDLRERDYDIETNTLNSPYSAKRRRVLAGWVNVGLHFK